MRVGALVDHEYGDLKVGLYDITTRTAGVTNLPPGFQTFEAAGHDSFFASDGKGQSNTPELLHYSGNTGASMAASTLATLTGKRITHPDWSRDGAMIRGGLIVRARLNRRSYVTGKTIPNKEIRALEIEKDDFLIHSRPLSRN